MSAWDTRRLKVLATRRYPGPAFDELRDVELGQLEEPRDDVEALIVANEPVPLERFPALRLVANFGVGYDRIDVAECTARGVAVTNTPGVLDAATADLAFALILAVRRRVVEGDDLVRGRGWRGSWAEGFLGRKITPQLAQEIGSQFSTRIEGTCVKHRFGKASIKMYDKAGIVLRIETTTNDVSFFKHHRKVEHRDGPSTREMAPVKKSIYSLIDLRTASIGPADEIT